MIWIKSINFLFSIVIIVLLSTCNKKNTEALQMITPIEKNIIYGNIEDNKLIYSSREKHIIIENLENQDTIFYQKIEDKYFVSPKVKGEFIYFGNSNNEFSCVNYKSNELVWKIETSNKPKNFIILNDSIGLLNVKHESILGVNLITGTQLYKLKYSYGKDCSSPDLSPYFISFDAYNFYVNNWQCKTIRVYDINSGHEIWDKNLINGISKSILFNGKLFVGVDYSYKEGLIYILDATDGKILNEYKKAHILLRRNPVLWNDKVIFYDYDKNSLKQYDFSTNKISTIKSYLEENEKKGIKSNEITGQLFLVNDFLFYQNSLFDIIKLDLNTHKETVIAKSKKGGISAVYIDKENKTTIFY